MDTFHGMEELLRKERTKATGILNGIDVDVWDPHKDIYLSHPMKSNDLEAFKNDNKKALLNRFNFNLDYPVISFIGRLVKEKGADLLPDLYQRMMYSGVKVAFLVLGSGQTEIEEIFLELKKKYPGRFDVHIGYDEELAHQIYAGSDFIMMPSRVEPCGLNQMYAMRYGTVPIVRAIGGLKDTVPDIDDFRTEGRGIQFTYFNLDDAALGIYRAGRLYMQTERFKNLREKLIDIDFSWKTSAEKYLQIYNQYL
jgi:starch synthase